MSFSTVSPERAPLDPANAVESDDVPAPGTAYYVAKRMIDIFVAAIGLAILSPFILVVMAVIAYDSRGPIFHRRRVLLQQTYRRGKTPRTFDAFKFRTMVPNADAILRGDARLREEYQREFKLKNDPRVTRVGAPLRHLSIDEIPQLLNVLRGQMTLVGPRMISPPELALYGPRAAKLLAVKPGLTGLWQVSGRHAISYAERIQLDMFYVDHRSLRLDMEILLRTIGSVLGRRGAF